MEYSTKRNIVIGIVVLLVIILGVWLWRRHEKKEGFMYPEQISYDNAPNFAPAQNSCANVSYAPQQGYDQSFGMAPALSYDMVADITLPDVNTEVPFHDIDVADPQVFLWRPSARVQLRSRIAEGADPLRGDLPIKKNACAGGLAWFNSQYNEADIKLDGAFSEFTNAKFAALTGQQSYPIVVANEEIIMDSSC